MGFLAPWFIAAVTVLGVPVFVHLLRRHVTSPRPVGSLAQARVCAAPHPVPGGGRPPGVSDRGEWHTFADGTGI